MFHFFGRKNLALTVNVPFDCKNACEFCTAKKSYKEYPGNLEAVKEAMRDMLYEHDFPIEDVVFTGGEPIANTGVLEDLVDIVPKNKNVYINTALPAENAVYFAEMVNGDPKIKCVNVSRHAEKPREETFEDCVTDEQIELLIKKPVRINVVLKNQDIRNVLDRWDGRNVEVSLRRNFTREMTPEELKNPYDEIVQRMIRDGWNVVGRSGCNVCETVRFEKQGRKAQYHRGMFHSSIARKTLLEINDLIIRQDGKVMYDWSDSDDRIMEGVKRLHSLGRPSWRWVAETGYNRELARTYACGGVDLARNVCGGGTSQRTTGGNCGGTGCGGR